MGKKNKQTSQQSSHDILNTLGDFTSKENWDKFFTIRGSDDSFEWYAEWPELCQPILPLLAGASLAGDDDSAFPPLPPPQILVPGCGSSRLSEHLYDSGFKDITNIDFSKVVISDMLRRNVRDRPGMRWRVMDMTGMQFADETFDIVLDKGGLDALMEPELGPKLGTQYLSEVQRVLKLGGKFICLTLAESHVIGLLFSMFRFGWKMNVHAIPEKPSSKPGLCTFMVVAVKENSTELHMITSLFNHLSLDCVGNQAVGLHEALEIENRIREENSSGSDILYSLEDLQLGAKGDLTKLSPGRRFLLILGRQGGSHFTYRAILLDAKRKSTTFTYHCGVFIVPKTRAHEWLFSSEEGQWLIVESSNAARLIMVILDSSHSNMSMDDIQKDLSPLVKQLAPSDVNGAQIPFMMAGDGIKQRDIVQKVTSSLTGPIIVEDVVYENVDDDISRLLPSKDLIFRRLVFQRTEGLVQSEALLTRDESSNKNFEMERKKTTSSSKSKKKGNRKRNDESSHQLHVYHDYLASSYHAGIISGFMLISSYFESVASAGNRVTSSLTGPIIVEDVVYENVDDDISRLLPSKDLIFRRLVFQRTEGLVQSEALLTRDESSNKNFEMERKKTTSSSKSKKKGNRKRNDESSHQLHVYHDYLASSYHAGIISGFMLISSYFESVASAGNRVNTVVVGLGAGLLPMFLHRCMQFLHVEVVELDPVILNVAREYFGFTEDEHLKVHIADGIKFVKEFKNLAPSDRVPVLDRKEDVSGSSKPSSNRNSTMSDSEGRENPGVDVLIIDVDSSDSRSGMTCPAADFVEESFLLTVKDSLSEQGLFIVNLVSRSSDIKDMVISRMKAVFTHLFSLQLEEDVNMILLGLHSEFCITEDSFTEATFRLGKLLKVKHPEVIRNIVDATKKIKSLK